MNPRHAIAIASEAALMGLSTVAVIALERLFTETSFLPEVLIMVIGSHLVALSVRRANLSMLWSGLLSASSLVLIGTAVFYPDSAALIFPTTETATVLGEDLREAGRVFSDDAAPVPPLRGFVVTASALVWLGAFLADWAAFRLRSPLEAITPATAVFIFAALLGVDRNEVAHGVLYAAGVIAVLLTMRAHRQVREEVWVASGTAEGISTTLRVGAAAGVIAVIGGAVIGPRVPGADDPPLIDITELNEGAQTRRVTSPLVEISSSLIEQSDEELFSVRVERSDRDYWRLMALTAFEGNMWERSSNFDDARGAVESNVDASVLRRSVRQEITTSALGNIYLPAAYEITEVIDDGGVGLEYEVATGALVVKEEDEDLALRGFSYVIESAVPDYDPALLPAEAARGLAQDFLEEHTRLPPECGPGETSAADRCWPAAVGELARQITQGAASDYERALMLQNHFTDPANYSYDVNVALGEGVDDIEDFLFQVRRGYCQQFAATFAAMARSLGIPARVAVGFTWGDFDPARGEYVVRGRHAHAWPEVYFADAGWVIFDPTPGRSRPHDGDVTGQTEALQFPANELSDPVVTTTVPAVTVPDGGTTDTAPAPATGSGQADPSLPESAPVEEPGSEGVPTALLVVLAIIVGGAGLVAIVPAIAGLRRRRRLHRVAADPVGRGELAWDDAVDALRLVGLRPSPGHTPLEFAHEVGRSRYELGPMHELAEQVTILRYADSDGLENALAAGEASAGVVARCREVAGRRTVVTDAIDPRSLVSSR